MPTDNHTYYCWFNVILPEPPPFSPLKILTAMRMVMIQDVPEVLEGIVEVDETYVGGQWKNKRKVERLQATTRGRRTRKQPVFGILCRNGYVWAEMVPGAESAILLPLIKKRAKRGSTVYYDTWIPGEGTLALCPMGIASSGRP